MKNCLLLLITVFTFCVLAQEKNKYDISPEKSGMQILKTADIHSSMEYKNDYISMTLLNEGYFTIGTTGGSSSGPLDNNCQITFGHPYAMTSYPLFSIDGSWYKIEDYFDRYSEITAYKSGDSLIIAAVHPSTVSVTFKLFYDPDIKTVNMLPVIKNLDKNDHKFGMGIVFDPALGKWGDGNLLIDGKFLDYSGEIQMGNSNTLNIWEKSSGAKGLGVALGFDKTPAKIIAGNWNELYENNSPGSYSINQKLYDLLLKTYWSEVKVAPGNVTTCAAHLSLPDPDFPKNLFLRWDIPSFLSVDTKLLFPGILNSYLELNKISSLPSGKTTIEVSLSGGFTTGSSTYEYSSAVPAYQVVNIVPPVKYENTTAELIARVKSDDGIVLDEIHRNIFTPATPVSDTGLTVTIDSLDNSHFPELTARFEVRRNDLGMKISNLKQENVFLYENSSRINSISFAKDSSGGADAADIVFVLDITGSMTDEINSVKQNIVEFANTLASGGTDYRLGMVTFLDYIGKKYPFTKDVNLFKGYISALYADGGDDEPENSLQALLEASQFPFRSNARRILIWITDATYHENDSFTSLSRKQVLDSILTKGIVVHAIGNANYKTSHYETFTLPTDGKFYDIYGNFKDILLDISQLKVIYKYLISWHSLAASAHQSELKLKIRYAGLGGETIVPASTSQPENTEKLMGFYPNPFNPQVTFRIKNSAYISGKVRIYNVLGQQVKEFRLDPGVMSSIVWDARNECGNPVVSGFYIAELTLTDQNNRQYVETAKLLFLK